MFTRFVIGFDMATFLACFGAPLDKNFING